MPGVSRGVTPAAVHAMEELESSRMINWLVRGSICDPALGGSGHHENWRFFGEMEWYLSCRQITHAADVLNAYCQSVLADIIELDDDAWDLARSTLGWKKVSRVNAAERLRKQRGPDGRIRNLMSEELSVFWNPQIDLIVTLRNKIVHQGGFDREGEVATAIADCAGTPTVIAPADHLDDEIPVEIDGSGRLEIDARAGHWATSHTSHNIHLMDQNITARFGLPTQRWVPRSRAFSFGTRPHTPSMPGTPLPMAGPEEIEPNEPPPLPPFHEYETMADPKEIECARTWREVWPELDEFIKTYCAERGVEITGLNGRLAGSPLSHTIRGYDHHLGYRLTAPGEDRQSVELGVRLRQRNFEPFITIWSDNTQMVEFEPCALSDEVEEELRTCIDKAASA